MRKIIKVIERSCVEQWDILFSMIGTIGNLYIETNSNIKYACKNMGIFQMGGDEMKSKWLYYYLQSPKAVEYIAAVSRGTTQGYVPLGALRKMPVDVVENNVRDKIVTFLWNLDEKIKTNIEVNNNLLEQVLAIYRHRFVDSANQLRQTCRADEYFDISIGKTPPRKKSHNGLALIPKMLLGYLFLIWVLVVYTLAKAPNNLQEKLLTVIMSKSYPIIPFCLVSN